MLLMNNEIGAYNIFKILTYNYETHTSLISATSLCFLSSYQLNIDNFRYLVFDRLKK